MARFPSVEWFDAVREVFNANPEYHGAGGGACETTFGVVVEQACFSLEMSGLECVDAREISNDKLTDLDFYLEMRVDEWEAMLRNIAESGSATLNYTLNTLDLDRPDRLAKSATGDQYREDMFFRFNQTLQHFFDASSRVETQF